MEKERQPSPIREFRNLGEAWNARQIELENNKMNVSASALSSDGKGSVKRHRLMVPLNEVEDVLAKLVEHYGGNLTKLAQEIGYASVSTVKDWHEAQEMPLVAANAARYLASTLDGAKAQEKTLTKEDAKEILKLAVDAGQIDIVKKVAEFL